MFEKETHSNFRIFYGEFRCLIIKEVTHDASARIAHNNGKHPSLLYSKCLLIKPQNEIVKHFLLSELLTIGADKDSLK